MYQVRYFKVDQGFIYIFAYGENDGVARSSRRRRRSSAPHLIVRIPAIMQKEDALLSYLSTTHIDICPHPPDAPRYQWILPRAKKCSPDTFCTSLWTGAALSNPLGGKKADTRMGLCFFGDPPGIRTPDPLLKRQLLCQLS